jgi:thiamine biosynthesis lipoprotein
MNSLELNLFEHVEACMGTTFRFAGRSALSGTEIQNIIAQACEILHEADRTFSLYKPESPLSQLARGETRVSDCPPVVAEIWDACDEWEKRTDGWFSAMTPQNTFDPSGIVKTWAAKRAAEYMLQAGIVDFTMNAGGDVWLSDELTADQDWRIAISKPISIASTDHAILTVIDLQNTDYRAMATSGSAERGNHIWNPKAPSKDSPTDLVQVSVVAKDLVTADVWATAAFAAGTRGIPLLEAVDEIEALFILANGDLAATDNFQSLFARA